MPNLTLTDRADDTIEAEAFADGEWSVTVTERGESAEVILSADQAVQLGRALLEVSDQDALLIPYATERERYNAEALTLAIDRGRLAVFQYEKGKGSSSIEKRRVKPEEAYLSGEGDPIVTGFDPDRQATRAFRLDRIVGYVKIG